MKILRPFSFIHFCRYYSKNHSHVLIAGGGTGGTSSAHNFVNMLGKDKVTIIEPRDTHYYQPMWTLVGAGAKTISQSGRKMSSVFPKNVNWIKESVMEFNPDKNSVSLSNGEKMTYDYLIVALGIKLDYEQITGGIEALKNDNRVGSNYSLQYVHKTFPAIQNFTDGNAIFTFPNTPVKCAGAPQKIMYLFDDYLRKNNKRTNASIKYYTSLPVIFGVKKYADKLNEICRERNLEVTTRHHLVEVDPLKHEATFEDLETKKKKKIEYQVLHITPPMRAYDVLKNSSLSDENGFVNVHKTTLQHVKYPNVFALGDCSNLPTSKTAAAVSVQHNVLYKNLSAFMKGEAADKLHYDGYTSCPLITRYDKCILAEFDYTSQPLETFPFDQGNENKMAFIMKAHLMPQLYWYGLITGIWKGPTIVRKILHLGNSK